MGFKSRTVGAGIDGVWTRRWLGLSFAFAFALGCGARQTSPRDTSTIVYAGPTREVATLSRVSGKVYVAPDGPTRRRMRYDWKDALTTTLRVCADPAGRVNHVATINTSGYPRYDRLTRLRVASWTFSNDEAVTLCSRITIRFDTRRPPPNL